MRLIGSGMFGATFLLGYKCRSAVIFGILKDYCLQINGSSLNNNFSHKDVFQNDVNSLSKMVIKNPVFFVKKLKISCIKMILDHTILFKFHQLMAHTHFLRNVCSDFRLPMSALAMVARKSVNCKFTSKIDFPIGHFMFTIADTDIESLNSLHILFDKYLYHMLVKCE